MKEPDVNLDANLGLGERVLWRGKPERTHFVFRTWPLSIFGGVLLAAVVAFEVTVFATDAPDVLACSGLLFALAALYMALGHFLVNFREWSNTEYMATESRILIRHGIFSPRIKVFSLAALPHTVIEMQGENVGNILFKPRQGEGYGPWPGYQTMWPYTPGYLLGLMYIRDPREVRKLLEEHRSAGT